MFPKTCLSIGYKCSAAYIAFNESHTTLHRYDDCGILNTHLAITMSTNVAGEPTGIIPDASQLILLTKSVSITQAIIAGVTIYLIIDRIGYHKKTV